MADEMSDEMAHPNRKKLLEVRAGPVSAPHRAVIETRRVEAVAWDPHRQVMVRVESGRGVVLQGLDQAPEVVWPVMRRRSVEDLAVHPDGRVVAALLTGLLWVDDGLAPETQKLPGGALCVQVDEHGNLAAGGGGGRVWLSRDDASLGHYAAHNSRVEAIDRKGTVLLSGGADARVVRADLTSEEMRTFIGHVDGITSVKIVDTDRVVSGSADGAIKLWQVSSDQPVWSIRLAGGGPVHALEICGGWLLATGRDRSVRVYDLENGQESGLFTGHSRAVGGLFATGPSTFCSCGRDRRLVSWHLDDRHASPPPFFGHSEGVRAVVLGDEHAWTASRDGTLRRWHLPTAQASGAALNVSQGAVQVLLERQDGYLEFGSTQGAVGIVDPRGRTLVHKELHDGPVTCLQALSDTLLVTGGADGVLRTWDRTTLAPLSARRDHTDRVRCLTVIDEAQGIVTGSYDHTLLRVHPLGGPILARFEGHTRPVIGVAVVEDTLVSGSLDGTVREWELDGTALSTASGDPDGVVGVVAVGPSHAVTVGRSGWVHLWALRPLAVVLKVHLGVPLDGLTARRRPDGTWNVLVGDQRGGLHHLVADPRLQTDPRAP